MAKIDTHHVKSWPELFAAADAGDKLHDVRDLRERDYKVGDQLVLEEYSPERGYTGRQAFFRITYITSELNPCAFSPSVLKPGYGILSIKKLYFPN